MGHIPGGRANHIRGCGIYPEGEPITCKDGAYTSANATLGAFLGITTSLVGSLVFCIGISFLGIMTSFGAAMGAAMAGCARFCVVSTRSAASTSLLPT
eukprot:839711-Prorocentrum_minimum.AAC.1